MKFKINYGTSVGAFPTECSEQIKRASLCDMKVLWLLCAERGECEASALCEFVGAGEKEILSSIAYWQGAGVISTDGEVEIASVPQEKPVEKKTEKPEKKLSREDELPKYTSDQLTVILEENQELASFISECQRIMGKMFSYHEVNVLIGLVDYLSLDFDYIMILLTYCVSHGKKTLHYVEKTAFGFYDSGITTVEQLTIELQKREDVLAAEGRIRQLFGIGGRALTTKEKKEISSWINDMGYSIEIIEKAYEVTVDATGGASLHYANSVLERWNSEGLRTIEQINESSEKYATQKEEKKKGKKSKPESENQNSSFDTDEFFEAAVRRSLGGGEDK